MPPLFVLVLLPVVLLAWPVAAWAGASLDIDDAAITPEGRCQVESWLRRESAQRQAVAVPACTVAATEVSLGVLGRDPGTGGAGLSLGLKRVLRAFDGRGWGLAIAAGASHEPGQGPGWVLALPASIALDPAQRNLVHLNLGWEAPDRARRAATAGIGLERVLDPRWTLLAELRGDDRGGAGGQLGLRRALGPNASLDLLAGRHRADGDGTRWLTLGLNVLLPQ
ncbi:MAG: hypothetical protein ABN502_15430 [Gammaproteobacteria bacterium]